MFGSAVLPLYIHLRAPFGSSACNMVNWNGENTVKVQIISESGKGIYVKWYICNMSEYKCFFCFFFIYKFYFLSFYLKQQLLSVTFYSGKPYFIFKYVTGKDDVNR